MRWLLIRSSRIVRTDSAIFVALAIWTFAPLVVLVAHVSLNGGVLTGTNGADYFDQFQYLAWIRDEGSHLLASNLWVIGGTPHDYVQPMYLISGLLWRLGLSLQLAYLIWKPIALLVLFIGFAGFARRMLVSRWAAASALILALFYESPVLALATWTGHLSSAHRLQLVLTTDDATSALNLWGFEHTAIAIGLMPVFLVAVEKLLEIAQAEQRIDRRWTTVAAIAGLLVAWLHPWQAVTLLAITGAVLAIRPSRQRLAAVVLPGVAAALPLAYGVALSRYDPSWSAFQRDLTMLGTAPGWALLASFAPLAVFAAAGIRRPSTDREWMLMLWPLACAAEYLIVPQFPPHTLAGVTLPLSVLAVRGWRRLRVLARVPVWVRAGLATAAVLAAALPAAILHVQGVHDEFAGTVAGAVALQQSRLTADQAATLSYLGRTPQEGGVLAPWLLSLSIPGLTGHEVYAGHLDWEPRGNVPADIAFFDSATRDPTGALHRAILRNSKATLVVVDCTSGPSIGRDIAPLARRVKRFGCLSVYETY
jgi:hypothetical protein